MGLPPLWPCDWEQQAGISGDSNCSRKAKARHFKLDGLQPGGPGLKFKSSCYACRPGIKRKWTLLNPVFGHCQMRMTASAQNTCPSTWSKKRPDVIEVTVVKVEPKSGSKRGKCFCAFKREVAMNSSTKKKLDILLSVLTAIRTVFAAFVTN